MIQLQIFKEQQIRLPRKMIYKLFENIYSRELSKKSQGVLNLIFSDDTRLKELNTKFRDKNTATDVLSFNIEEPTDTDAVYGEIYISVPTARKQANDYNAPISEEIIRLCCHGFLHLLGYDHINAEDAKIMQTKEKKYLTKVYA